MKDSFILYQEQKEIFDMLTDEEAGKLIKAIFEYEDTGQLLELDKSLKIAFIPIKSTLDRNQEKYEKVVERNKKNIEKRWKKENTKNTSGKSGKKENTKNTDNDNEHEYEHDNDNVNKKENKKEKVVSDSCIDGLQKIIDFYNNNISMLTPHGLTVLSDYAKEMDYEVVIYAMQIAVEANKRNIRYIKAILNNWSKSGIKTLIEAREETQKFKNGNNQSDSQETQEEKNARRLKEIQEAMNGTK